MTLDDLPFPFYAASDASTFADMDLSFAYHALITDNKVAVMCNDLPCNLCPFECKEGRNRQEVLSKFAKENFPEYCI